MNRSQRHQVPQTGFYFQLKASLTRNRYFSEKQTSLQFLQYLKSLWLKGVFHILH